MNAFNIKAFIGKLLMDRHLKSMGKTLGVKSQVFSDEVNIIWDEIRQGKKETILYLHGFSDRKENFYYAAKILSSTYDIIMPELPGFGGSEKHHNCHYGITNYILWFERFLLSLNIEKLHLAGNSMGGTISAHLAVNHPEKVTSLTLIDSAGIVLDKYNTFYEEVFENKCPFLIKSEQEYEIFRQRIFFSQVKIPNFVKEYLIKEMIDNHDWYKKILHDIFDEKFLDELIANKSAIILNDLFSKITIPVNIIWGKEDTFFPYQMAECAHKAIKSSRLRILENVGHCPQLENPKLFSKTLMGLLNL
jgi:pimeloyl-ACP methyl ester carboxylesterase